MWILREKFVNVQYRLLLGINIVRHSDYNYRHLHYCMSHVTLRQTMANLEWLLCLLRVAMYWDVQACNDVTDTTTEYNIHIADARYHIANDARPDAQYHIVL